MSTYLERFPVVIDDQNLITFLKEVKDDLFSEDPTVRYYPEAIVLKSGETTVDLYWLQLVIAKVLSSGGFGDSIFDFSNKKGFGEQNFSTKTLTTLVDSQKEEATFAGGTVY